MSKKGSIYITIWECNSIGVEYQLRLKGNSLFIAFNDISLIVT